MSASQMRRLKPNGWQKLIRKWRTFRRMPWFQKKWMPFIWIILGISKIFIFHFPFKRLAVWLGFNVGAAGFIPLLTPRQQWQALMIGRAIRTIAPYTPWESNCFPQAIAARILLSWYGVPYAFFFGLNRDPNTKKISAHAWVSADRIRVTGGDSFPNFTVLGCFVDRRLMASIGAP